MRVHGKNGELICEINALPKSGSDGNKRAIPTRSWN